ncbi:response regulator transcription factor [Trinickia fusca]|uniref:DNA-binding response regulator n=1 Tax=Trinickia fusca TaxID=2419777 RepID=A0A494X9Z7_9BURK|nr:DNA-binding response regulator [Trinickia fusca]
MQTLDDEEESTAATIAVEAVGPRALAVDLSPRENEVLALIAKGFSLKESAKLMEVSRHTVVTFVRRLYLKLDVHSKSEAIFEAHQLGLLELERIAPAARARPTSSASAAPKASIRHAAPAVPTR